MLQELIGRWGDQWPSELAHVDAYRDDSDRAFDWLARAVAQNEHGLTRPFLESLYKPVHNDLRWTEFLERAGSAQEQLDATEFEVKFAE